MPPQEDDERLVADYMRQRAQADTPPDLLPEALRVAAATPQRRRRRLARVAAPVAVVAGAAVVTLVAIGLLQRPPPPDAPIPGATVSVTQTMASSPSAVRPGVVGAGDLVTSDAPLDLYSERNRESSSRQIDISTRPAYVVADPVADSGEVWYRLQAPEDDLRPFGWAAFASIDEADSALTAVEARCPDARPVSLGDFAELTAAERLLCFAGAIVSVGAGRILQGPGAAPIGGEPPWFIVPSDGDDPRVGLYTAAGSAPEASADEVVGVHGRVDHPAADECERAVGQDDYEETAAEQELWCRQRFVFEGLERLAP